MQGKKDQTYSRERQDELQEERWVQGQADFTRVDRLTYLCPTEERRGSLLSTEVQNCYQTQQ